MGRVRNHARSKRRRSALSRFAGWIAVTALAPLFLLPAGAAFGASAAAVPFAVQVSASPSAGTIPLTVSFAATVTAGVPSAVDWTFGDGASWNGTGVAALNVLHRYVSVGTFVAVATVIETSGTSSAFTRVSVESGPLSAAIAVTTESGAAPLGVTFRALVSGGTGTYTAFSWAFGDGAVGAGPVVNYTYPVQGAFTATLTVRDSANDTVGASVRVNVSAPTAAAAGISAWSVPTTLATAGIVGAGLAWGSLYLGRRRRGRSAASFDEPDAGSGIPPGALAGARGMAVGDVLPGAVAAAAVASASIPAPATEESRPTATAPAPDGVRSTPPPFLPSLRSAPVVLAPPQDEPKRWSREVVAYLGSLPILGPDDIPSLDWTQKGMSERLGTGQNQVSNVLRRLVAAGIVHDQLEHVQGQPRRLKVYRLTPRGEALAREVRRRRAAAQGRPAPYGRT